MGRVLRTPERTFLLALVDTASASGAVLLAMWTWSLTAGFGYSPLFVRDHTWWFVAVPVWVFALSPTRHSSKAFDVRATTSGVLRAGGVLLVGYLGAFFYAGPDNLPRLVAVYVLWNAAWLTLGGRLLFVWTLTRDTFSRRLLVVGDASAAGAALELGHAAALRDAIVLAPVSIAACDGPGTDDSLERLAANQGATEIVVASTGPLDRSALDQLLRCQEAGIDVVTFERVYEQALHRVPVRHVGHDWVLTQLFSGAGQGDSSLLAKRVLDVAVALALGLGGVVFAAAASLAIRLESGPPVLYSQVREGRGGRLFVLTKFRTMARDAEADGPQWSRENDPRITRVGRLLRRTHIDELPNLWAVLRGDMSMVGPRPERPEFVAELERQVPLYRARFTVAPGLTGWAQVNTEYGDSVEDATRKLEYDLYYVRHRSLWFDLRILGRTVGRILGRKGR